MNLPAFFYLNRSRTACSTFSLVSGSRCSADACTTDSVVAGVTDGAGEFEMSAEILMHTDAPHAGQRAVRVRSSMFMSDEKSNELFAPHLQGTYFLSETISITSKKNGAEVNNFIPL